MSLAHTGKLLVRFIKDFSSVIMEQQTIPKPIPNKKFYMWFGVIPNNDNKSEDTNFDAYIKNRDKHN